MIRLRHLHEIFKQSVSPVCLIVFVSLHSLGCAPAIQHPGNSLDLLEVGLRLRQHGDHLNAGYWLEAALAQHPNEEQVLLRLIVEEQILAGRLLAAQSGLNRLRDICGDSQEIVQLASAIQFATDDSYQHSSRKTKEPLP